MNLTQAIERLTSIGDVDSSTGQVVVPFTSDNESVLSSDDVFFVFKDNMYVGSAGQYQNGVCIGVCRKDDLVTIQFTPDVGQVHTCDYNKILFYKFHKKI